MTDTFPTSFAEERIALLNALGSVSTVSKDEVPGALDSLQQRLAKLNALYTQNASSLPSYDQRRCQQQLKELSERISQEKTKSLPKQKFSFKSRAKGNSSTTSSPSPSAILVEPIIPDIPPENGVTFSSQSNAYLSIVQDMHASSIRLLSLSDCVVNLLEPRRHATFHANGVSNSLILVSTVDGAAHLTNLTNCVVVLKCHQFRMHDSHGTDVYLSCSSRPIIENSTGIVFAEYPRTVAEKAGIDKQQEEWVVKGLVEDFNWLRKEHSPNWSISEKLREDTWQKVLENTKIPSVDTILDLVIER